jgi:hypothetical protein
MTLILCEPGDASALWVAAELQQRGIEAELLFSSALGSAVRWEHRIDGTAVSTSITLGDGRILSSETPRPILNRLSFVPLVQLRATAGADYGYAIQELYAFYLSWLTAWPAAVINRPAPQGLAGSYRHASQWAQMAAQAGLPSLPWQQDDRAEPEQAWMAAPAEAMAFAVGGEAVLPPALPPDFEAPCIKLAALAGSELLGIGFVRHGGGWVVSGAAPVPDLTIGGPRLADALARALS